MITKTRFSFSRILPNLSLVGLGDSFMGTSFPGGGHGGLGKGRLSWDI